MNKNNYRTNYRRPEKDIIPHEFYSTNKDSVRTFLTEFLKSHSIEYAWEPACGLGNISKVCEEFDIDIVASDLIDRGYGLGNLDFLKATMLPNLKLDTIITNPPFKQAVSFIEKAFELKPKRFIIMYLKLTFLEGKERYKMFQKYQPAEIWLHPNRQACSNIGAEEFENGGATAYCWYVWRTNKGMNPVFPELHWLPIN